MHNLSNIGTIKSLLQKYGFTFSKQLGQNFLINPSVCPRMAELSGAKEGVGVLEIGAGIGVLTQELAKRAAKVVCVEIDARLLPILDETLGEFENVTIVNQDVMKVDLHALLQEHFGGMPVVVCANLPYYITSPILMRLLEERLPIEKITVMVQKEAAARICAEEGTRDIGALSMAVRYYSHPHVLFPVSRGSFLPAPEVDSAVIQLDVFSQPPIKPIREKALFALIKGAFSQRRKTLPNTLNSTLKIPKDEILAVLGQLQIKPTARAEELNLQQFCQIADAFVQKGLL